MTLQEALRGYGALARGSTALRARLLVSPLALAGQAGRVRLHLSQALEGAVTVRAHYTPPASHAVIDVELHPPKPG